MKNNWKKTAALLLSLIVLISIIPVNVLALMVPVNITETSGAVSLRGVFKDRAVDTFEFYLNGELIRSQKIKGGDILYEPETTGGNEVRAITFEDLILEVNCTP